MEQPERVESDRGASKGLTLQGSVLQTPAPQNATSQYRLDVHTRSTAMLVPLDVRRQSRDLVGRGRLAARAAAGCDHGNGQGRRASETGACRDRRDDPEIETGGGALQPLRSDRHRENREVA